MPSKGTILYIGGFELPDKNAAAHRVIGIAKGLRELGYRVVFLNSIKNLGIDREVNKDYFEFQCLEYNRERKTDYLFSGKTAIRMIQRVNPGIIIAYNYPAFALNKIRHYCRKHDIRCFADATEWYKTTDGPIIYRIIKNIDTAYRMRFVHKKLDGIIAISRYLYDYYKNVNTVLIPPTVDVTDKKWENTTNTNHSITSFVYAGSPSAQKERLDIIINAIEQVKDEYSLCLNILGITEQQYKDIYSVDGSISNSVIFWGRVDHLEALRIISDSCWSIILRDNNRVVKAGFPTKLVESITCGTPVVVNRFSNIEEYLNSSNSIIIYNTDNISEYIKEACKTRKSPDRRIFDYHTFVDELKALLDNN